MLATVVSREYRRMRLLGNTAAYALRAAKVRAAFADLEAFGAVRFVVTPDECGYMAGDCDDEAYVNERLEREGLWTIAVEGSFDGGETWEHIDAVGGFIGEDWRDSGYDVDLMEAAVEAACDSSRYAPCDDGSSEPHEYERCEDQL